MHRPSTLLLLVLGLLLVGCTARYATATSLTYKLKPSEKACFYTWVDQAGKKVAFYFAVQSGGNFDVDYSVTDPHGKLLMSGKRERQADHVYTVEKPGEHSHCIFNTYSTAVEKLIDVELTAQDDKFSVSAVMPGVGKKEGEVKEEHLSPLEDALFRLGADLSSISRNQKYFRTRENRNFGTVLSTESRIFNFSLFGCILAVGMSFMQVFVVRMLFQQQGGAYGAVKPRI